MDKLLYLIPSLACPISMGLMMWLMMRPKKGAQPDLPAADRQELARLSKELDALRSTQAPQDHPA
jgi:hypothetical protein